ncbi:MAG: DUF4198 domain-containing protein [Bryobacteraceae bacterium]|nr:DUF4198 domain-containing protein [Bryobacteraceae bacterium]
MTIWLLAGLLAHDLYLMPERFSTRTGETLTIAVHNGDSFPASDGAPVLARLRGASGPVTIQGTRGIYAHRVTSPVTGVYTVPNFLSMDPRKFANYLRSEGIRVPAGSGPSRELYAKFAKTILGTGPGWDQPLGHAIEIIPRRHPADLKAGDSLPLLVLLAGKPAADVQIQAWRAGDNPAVAGRTDAAGQISIPIRSAGTWKLHGVAMVRAADRAQADWESYWVSLTFEVR